MSGSKARLQAIDAVKGYAPPPGIFPSPEPPGQIFGQNVFTKAVMQQRLPKPVFKSLMATIEHSSNAGLCSENRGLTNAGLRLGYRF